MIDKKRTLFLKSMIGETILKTMVIENCAGLYNKKNNFRIVWRPKKISAEMLYKK